MAHSDIRLEFLPDLTKPLVIAGFGGWGNALDVSTAMIDFLVRRLDARPFASLKPDSFFRYDESRPWILVRRGSLKHLRPTAGTVYFARGAGGGPDCVLLRSEEPDFNWYRFADAIVGLTGKIGGRNIVTIGSLLDAVLPSERPVSAIASDPAFFKNPKARGIVPIDYHGPSAVHSVIQQQGTAKGFDCVSIWCHCPYYLKGVTDFGAMNHLCQTLSSLLDLELEFDEITDKWEKLRSKVIALIEESDGLKSLITDIQKAKIREKHDRIISRSGHGKKVIDLKAFFENDH